MGVEGTPVRIFKFSLDLAYAKYCKIKRLTDHRKTREKKTHKTRLSLEYMVLKRKKCIIGCVIKADYDWRDGGLK